ncbi:asparagine synthase-related protein [Streptomyces sp. NPDC092307]|uniref:asparagine synthase-related protein n=1 Tax=Streptomyces sp. NPDC092307 TaxID=3366013 RepID=UPI0037F29CF2
MFDHLTRASQNWFVALPDCAAAGALGERLRPAAHQEFRYPSGRIWLLGHWTTDQVAQGAAGNVRMVAAGFFSPTTDLGRMTSAVRCPVDLDRVVATMAGSFHLVAAVDGVLRVQGSVSGVRRVFHTTIDGMSIASDRADVLAYLAGVLTDVDEDALAARLLTPQAPHPLTANSLWKAVRPLPCDSYLVVDRHGRSSVVRWWSPPEPGLDLNEGAPLLRKSLGDAVDVRVRAQHTVSSDLSGGLDSTTLCFLAARSAPRLLTVTVRWDDPGNEDAVCADRAAAHLPGIERFVLGAGDLPPMFDDIAEVGIPLDEPYFAVHDRARHLSIAARLAGDGSTVHLSGLGGDEVLHAPVSYLHPLARTQRRVAFRHTRGYRHRERWSLPSLWHGLTDRSSYAAWLRESAGTLEELFRGTPPPGAWWYPVRMPPWSTPEAVDSVRRALLRSAEYAEPLGPERGQHAALGTVRIAGHVARLAGHTMASAGLPVSFPFLDDSVVEACLSVHPHERTTPTAYKPLLRSAFDSLVPAAVLARNSKDHCATEWFRGLRRRRPEIDMLCEDSLLARRGLINAKAFRAACTSPAPSSLPLPALEWTLACERWLRELDELAHPTHS